MLTITVPSIPLLFDDEKQLFLSSKEQELVLEHSLISLSKWESKWHKPFLTKIQKTEEQDRDYIKCMTMNKNVDDQTYKIITSSLMDQINLYIQDPMSATTFPHQEKKSSNELITAELIYFWMVNYNIPFECEKWHLNRLLTLINVCSIKNAPPKKKMSAQALAARNRELNAQRLKQYNTTG